MTTAGIWAPEETQYLITHWGSLSDGAIAAALNRTVGSVRSKRKALKLRKGKVELSSAIRSVGKKKNKKRTNVIWRANELTWLKEDWGVKSVADIAHRLRRTKEAVKSKAHQLGLKPLIGREGLIIDDVVVRILGVKNRSVLQNWVKAYNLSASLQYVSGKKRLSFHPEDLLAWMMSNQDLWECRYLPFEYFGPEPLWLTKKREIDVSNSSSIRFWTGIEDEQAVALFKSGLSYRLIGERMKRTASSVRNRLNKLRTQVVCDEIPGRSRPWTPGEEAFAVEMALDGHSYQSIASRLNRTEHVVRYRVKNAILKNEALPDEERYRQMLLFRFTEILSIQKNKLLFGAYWMRHQCAKWDDAKGCLAGERDCESCISYIRIREQYCIRCGATFLETNVKRHCPSCREERKNKYVRKLIRKSQQGKCTGIGQFSEIESII